MECYLDIDMMDEELYEKLILECKKRYQDENNIENTENVNISKIEIKFEVE